MNDPTSPLAPAHAMSAVEWLIVASGAVASAVAGGVAAALGVGKRVAKLEEAAAARTSVVPDTAQMRDEIAAFKRDVNAAIAAQAAGAANPMHLASTVEAAVSRATNPLQRQLDTMQADLRHTDAELTRVRAAADSAEREGAQRWTETARALATLESTIRNG